MLTKYGNLGLDWILEQKRVIIEKTGEVSSLVNSVVPMFLILINIPWLCGM